MRACATIGLGRLNSSNVVIAHGTVRLEAGTYASSIESQSDTLGMITLGTTFLHEQFCY